MCATEWRGLTVITGMTETWTLRLLALTMTLAEPLRVIQVNTWSEGHTVLVITSVRPAKDSDVFGVATVVLLAPVINAECEGQLTELYAIFMHGRIPVLDV
ncbi:unnamed protein product [Fusarium graminearum]|uniref:Secreted protein n=1 Tax=Gibberella zeae TaxID=5518 RepID=A0A4E9ED37_GIBZA|nr:unnamed protein product [Fusarium graminearum]CAG1969053.1 unnamed protein product [Fusarium graminearum]CAG1983989.1 unnamed protein product [Fusarium graminearum]